MELGGCMKKWLAGIIVCGSMLCLTEAAQSQTQWTRKLSGYYGLCVTVNPQNPQTAFGSVTPTLRSDSRLYVSRDAGGNWDTLWTAPGFIFDIVVHPIDTTIMFVGTPDVWRSTDAGIHWSRVLDSVAIVGEAILVDPISPNKIYAASSTVGLGRKGGFWTSTDYGVTWSLAPSTQGNNYCTIALRPDSPNILYGGLDSGTIQRTTDYGATWTTVRAGGGTEELPIIVIDRRNPLVAYAVIYAAPGGVLKTTDGGASWFESGLNGVSLWSLDIDPDNSSTILAGELDSLGRMFRSTDAGLTWMDISNGLPRGINDVGHYWVKIVSMDPPLVLAAVLGSTGQGGIYKLEKVTSVHRVKDGIPVRFSLEQNYPNPFNPSTRIGFAVTGSGFVSLKVHDVLGREVATLVSEVLQPGSYTTTWDAARMPSGVYFYRLKAKDFMETKKMLLLK